MDIEILVIGFSILLAIIIYFIFEISSLKKKIEESEKIKKVYEEQEKIYRTEIKSLKNRIKGC